jgi:hypothetical protein
MHTQRTLMLFLAVTAIATSMACDSSTRPEQTKLLMTNGSDGEGVRIDTTRYAPTPALLTGHVLAVTEIVPQPGSNDTLRFEGVGGASVRIVRNVRLGESVQQEVMAKTTSASDGSFRIENLPGGYYIIDVTVPASSPYASNTAYLHASASQVTQNVHLFRKP